MNRFEHDDADLRDAFSEARRADEASTPSFEAIVRRARREARPRPVGTRRLFFAVATGTASSIVALAAMWIALRAPAPMPGAVPILPPESADQAPVLPPPPPPSPYQDEAANGPLATGERVDRASGRLPRAVEPPRGDLPVAQARKREVLPAAPGRVGEDPSVAGGSREHVLGGVVGGVLGGVSGGVPPADAPPRRTSRDIDPQAIERVEVAAYRRTHTDGVSNVDPMAGHELSNINPNSIDEVELIATGASVAPGRAQGGLAGIGVERVVIEPEASAPSLDTEHYDDVEENPFRLVADHPLSTFSIDVDTASYANVRRMLAKGRRPPASAVRIEEMINYFEYAYPEPAGDDPFSVDVATAACPWSPDHRLVRIGLRGRSSDRGELPGSNLVFLIDVSGSMEAPNKLPLLVEALSMLVQQLDGRDQVAIVVYAGSTGVVLPPTPGDAKGEILDALRRLSAGGSTNGGAGLELAYRLARDHFVPGGLNRVILATDGDLNVGVTDRGELLRLIGTDARRGIFLTVLGFGYGNLQDGLLEGLADKGNGNYAYIDSLDEARKVLVEEIGGTLVTIARDVKIQVEFNPARVAGYRLIGYENRALSSEDFNDDTKDAGEIGAGHTVTALYEVVPAGSEARQPSVDPLRYQTVRAPSDAAESGELLTVKLRYQPPEGGTSQLIVRPVTDDGRSFEAADPDFKFAAAVAAFGMILRDSPHRGEATLDQVERMALAGLGDDARGTRRGLTDLIDRTRKLDLGADTD